MASLMVGAQLVGVAHVDGGAVGGGDAVADHAGAPLRVERCEAWTRRNDELAEYMYKGSGAEPLRP